MEKNNTFNQKQFNLDFEKNDIKLNKSKIINKQLSFDIEKNIKLPHQQSIEEIIISIREILFTIIDMIDSKTNPIPFILSSDSRMFSFSLMMIIFGTLLLLLSSLMKSPNDSFN